jgi:hypothetical protein
MENIMFVDPDPEKIENKIKQKSQLEISSWLS